MGQITQKTWQKIRTKFVRGIGQKGSLKFPSIMALSKEFKISRDLVAARAKKDNWEKQRAEYKQRLVKERETSISTLVSERMERKDQTLPAVIAEFDLNCLKLAIIGIDICREKLTEIMGNKKSGVYGLKIVAEALEKFQKIGKNSVGEVLPSDEAGKTAVIVINEIGGTQKTPVNEFVCVEDSQE